jgi:uncharacterized membrane protein YcaP (DUF421 family)
MNWADLFGFTLSPLEIVVRGSAVYWFVYLIFRLVLRREAGALGIADVLVIVLIADASQNAMAGEYRSISEGFVLIATIVFWNYTMDWAAFRWPRIGRLLEPPPLNLIERGKMLRANMRREFIGAEELMSKLREHGIDDLAQVKRAVLESNGEVSVVRLDEERTTAPGRSTAPSP